MVQIDHGKRVCFNRSTKAKMTARMESLLDRVDKYPGTVLHADLMAMDSACPLHTYVPLLQVHAFLCVFAEHAAADMSDFEIQMCIDLAESILSAVRRQQSLREAFQNP